MAFLNNSSARLHKIEASTNIAESPSRKSNQIRIQNAKFPAWLRLKHGKNRENVVFWSVAPFAIHQKSLTLSRAPMVCFSCVHSEKSRRSFKVGSIKQPFNKALSTILSGYPTRPERIIFLDRAAVWHKRPLPLGS